MFIVDRMTPNPITVDISTSVADASHLMRKHIIRRLPVMKEGKLVGIVTDRNLRDVSPSPATSLSCYEILTLLDKITMGDIMSRKLYTIRTDATIEEAALMMCEHKISGLPVLAPNGTLAGIITQDDIFRSFVDVMGLTKGKTRITINVKDQIGVVSKLAKIFADAGINIASIVTYPIGEGTSQVVIRISQENVDALLETLAQNEFAAQHVARIG